MFDGLPGDVDRLLKSVTRFVDVVVGRVYRAYANELLDMIDHFVNSVREISITPHEYEERLRIMSDLTRLLDPNLYDFGAIMPLSDEWTQNIIRFTIMNKVGDPIGVDMGCIKAELIKSITITFDEPPLIYMPGSDLVGMTYHTVDLTFSETAKLLEVEVESDVSSMILGVTRGTLGLWAVGKAGSDNLANCIIVLARNF